MLFQLNFRVRNRVVFLFLFPLVSVSGGTYTIFWSVWIWIRNTALKRYDFVRLLCSS